MSYAKKLWENRNVQFPNRRTLTNVATGEVLTVDAERMEGIIHTDGDPFSAATMNSMEQRIADGFADSEGDIGKVNSSLRQQIDDLDKKNVKLSGAQNVDGVKTFSSVPVTTAGNPTSDDELARKAYVDTKAESAVNSAKSYLVTTVAITNTNWIGTNSNYYYKSTGVTVPVGYDWQAIDLYIPVTSLAILNRSQVGFVGVESGANIVYIYCGTVPNAGFTISLRFSQTRTA